MNAHSKHAGFLIFLCFLAIPACRVTDLTLWKPVTAPVDSYEVIRKRDVAYRSGNDTDSFRHRLDIYSPGGVSDAPVVVLVHGGAWMLGGNRCCGLYPSVGEFLASQGMVAV